MENHVAGQSKSLEEPEDRNPEREAERAHLWQEGSGGPRVCRAMLARGSFGNAVPGLTFHWSVTKRDVLDVRGRVVTFISLAAGGAL